METNTVLLLVLLVLAFVGHLAALLGVVYALRKQPLQVNVNTEVIANPEVGAKNYLQQLPADQPPQTTNEFDERQLDDLTAADWWKRGERPPDEC